MSVKWAFITDGMNGFMAEIKLLFVEISANVAVLKPFMYWDMTSLSDDTVILFIPPLIRGKNNLLATLDFPLKPIKLISNVLLYNINVSRAELFLNEVMIPNIQAKA